MPNAKGPPAAKRTSPRFPLPDPPNFRPMRSVTNAQRQSLTDLLHGIVIELTPSIEGAPREDPRTIWNEITEATSETDAGDAEDATPVDPKDHAVDEICNAIEWFWLLKATRREEASRTQIKKALGSVATAALRYRQSVDELPQIARLLLEKQARQLMHPSETPFNETRELLPLALGRQRVRLSIEGANRVGDWARIVDLSITKKRGESQEVYARRMLTEACAKVLERLLGLRMSRTKKAAKGQRTPTEILAAILEVAQPGLGDEASMAMDDMLRSRQQPASRRDGK